MTTWLFRLDSPGDGPRLAVKDAIDVEGTPTTAGCPVISDRAEAAGRDATAVASARAQGARIIGKTNLTELCRAADGVNPWTGTPVNPLDSSRVPGGSSSGSAVAVATGEADVALGTDTAGSVRIPAACCGVVGLKTTYGRVPLEGVFPFAESLDTLGPLGPDVAAVALGMRLLEPGFTPAAYDPGAPVGRLRPEGVAVDPVLDAAVDAALRAAGLAAHDEAVGRWRDAIAAGDTVICGEGYRAHRRLLAYPDRMSVRIRRRIEHGERISDGGLDDAYAVRTDIRKLFDGLFGRYSVLALPTLLRTAPHLGAEREVALTDLTLPFNLTGHPALAMPVPAPGSPLPGSLQLVAPHGGEERLLAFAKAIESAIS